MPLPSLHPKPLENLSKNLQLEQRNLPGERKSMKEWVADRLVPIHDLFDVVLGLDSSNLREKV